MPTQNNHSSQDMQQWPSAMQVCEQIDTCSEAANDRLINAAKHLHPCMLVNQLQHMTPFEGFGFLLLWYASSMEQLSSMHQQWFHILLHMETPPWTQCQSSQHCSKWHHCHTAGSVNTLLYSGTTCITPTLHHACSPHLLHLHHWQPDETGSSCSCHASCSKEWPSTNAYSIPCHTCAATKIWPCPHGTKMPDPGDLGTIDPDCPQTWYHNVPPHTSPINCCSKLPCNIFSERGMLYDCFRFKNCSTAVNW